MYLPLALESTSRLDLSTDLARRIKAARNLSGKKVRELADEFGWSSEKVYRLERGDQVPDALELVAIATATGQPLDFFLPTTSQAGNGAVLTREPGSDNPAMVQEAAPVT